MEHETILILDFGGQYNQLIGRRVRDLNVYCEILPYRTPLDKIKARTYKGIIFTGGPKSVYAPGSPSYDPAIFDLGIPILGICYGAQFMAYALGGQVAPAAEREYGHSDLTITDTSDLIFKNVPKQTAGWMSHTDQITRVPAGFHITAATPTCPVGAMSCPERRLYGVQFHPEVNHTPEGNTMLRNFLYEVCGCSGDWQMSTFVENTVDRLRTELAGKKVLAAFSGGVDSSVASLMVHKAVGSQLTCIFVDHGLLRKNEGDEVMSVFAHSFNMNIIRVNARERFLSKLAGVTDPERKRKIIGEEFIRVFEEEARKIGKVDVLVQGTIYPDVIESGTDDAATIKSHHNVGGLPKNIEFKELVEPLRDLFKDEVRRAGTEMGIPDELVWRQPFPGPGLAVRILGDITADKIALLQDADAIFREEVAKAGLNREISQYFAVLTNLRSVGVMGDSRTYDYTVALRAVTTQDFMTSDWAKIPYEVLERVSSRIVNEVQHVNRVVYDITTKPPATIEWE
ncbi:glutamine-hydrolyzing GMP synthase [Oscillospiraceae bacterium HV4-5-C5C]|nr:glutamine-hydrolyzing GMP synthase [Oscillospiraceae bacterium HV4-5-C5C]